MSLFATQVPELIKIATDYLPRAAFHDIIVALYQRIESIESKAMGVLGTRSRTLTKWTDLTITPHIEVWWKVFSREFK